MTTKFKLKDHGEDWRDVECDDQHDIGNDEDMQVKCASCGSTDLDIDNGLGYGDYTGPYGILTIDCKCGNKAEYDCDDGWIDEL